MKIDILQTSDKKFDSTFQRRVFDAHSSAHATVTTVVAKQINAIRRQRDAGLLNLVRKYDGWNPTRAQSLRVTPRQMQAALSKIPAPVAAALKKAYMRIKQFSIKQKIAPFTVHSSRRSWCSMRVLPLSRVGIYVPGGTASYPSTLLMNAIPAIVAGVKEIVAVHPALHGKVSDVVLATGALCGIKEMYKVGGAGAVAALAYGTPSIAAVDKIVGPGNQYVAEAKRQLFGTVGIDMVAGPSEIVVLFDRSASQAWVASDMLAQAEHDQYARAIGITTSLAHANKVKKALVELCASLPRKDIIKRSFLRGSMLIVAKSLQESIALSNMIAPEHLHLHLKNASSLLPKITNAGSIFVGKHSAEAFGDYCAGPNHVLPTSRSARFQSPLGAYDFQKRQNVINLSSPHASKLAPIAATLAELEGLDAHALSAQFRNSG